ncbi:hypothetical protein ACH470_33560 [Streptomyces bottropensis]|uniref:hypothetical protein n=1 Tax=Streptomyces bottropensis TaxID=42235 RepID=UPI00378AB786
MATVAMDTVAMDTVAMDTVIMTAVSTVVVVHRSPTQYRCRRRCRRLRRRGNRAAASAFMNGSEQDFVSADLVNFVDVVDDFTAFAGPRMYVRSLPQPCGRTNALR